MTQVEVTKIQVTAYLGTTHRKYFSDIAPNPLPIVGDFISTKNLEYYTKEDDDNLKAHHSDNAYIQITSRIFHKLESNEWIILYSGTIT